MTETKSSLVWYWIGEEYERKVLLPGAYIEILIEALEAWLHDIN